MPYSLGTLLALAALAGLSLSSMPRTHAAGDMMIVSICGNGLTIAIPIGHKGAPSPDCPSACHAICTRKALLEPEES